MAPNFFSKLVKPNAKSDGGRTPSPTSPKHPTISISRASHSTHRPSDSLSSNRTDTDNDSINPNVTIIPPSPRTSDMSSGANTPKEGQSIEDLKSTSKKPRRQHTLSLSSNPPPPLSASDDDAVTPTPSRPNMTERELTLRPLSHSSSTGNLREGGSPDQAYHPRSATVATGFERQRTPSLKSNKSNKSSRSGLRIKTKGDKSDAASPPRSKHDRAATSPPDASAENGNVTMTPIVESPTRIRGSNTIADVGPSHHALSASATVPHIPNSSLLSAPDNSDAASVYSVSSTGKKRKIFRRLSMKESAPLSPSASTGSKSPKRKNTGLAGALAASGLAMANPVVSMPQITPAEIIARDERSSNSNTGVGMHRSRTSVDRTRSPARSRQTSLSYPGSEYSDRDSFVSGIEGSDEDDDLDLDADDIPVTGFAVASARRNQEFHEMFPSVPEGDYLIEDYGCALQREILIQGRLYISENHICFHANLFGWVTDLTIPMYDVVALDKRMTAFVIPNAILVTTRNAKYTFTSFLSRDTTFDVIYNVWRLARPEDSASQIVSTRGSLDQSNESGEAAPGVVNGKPKAKANKVTHCACGKGGQHYTDTAMETVFPGTPEKIYNLMFTSGFIKDFMREGQKLIDIQISDWMPLPNNATLLARNMSYIKPLTASIGPRQTKCEIRDEMAHCDFDEYVSMVTTTRTPEVPSGGVFSVKTRTCIMWASSVSTRVIVTSQVEWTGRSFIKGIVEKSAIDGQKTYHKELEAAMRDYIHKHQSEFLPEGVDVEEAEAVSPTVETPVSTTQPETPGDEDAQKQRERAQNQRGLQLAYDTFEGAMKVAKQSAEGAFEILSDTWNQSSSTSLLYGIIALLVISNIWTLTMMGRREEAGRRKEARRTEEREKWVQGVVTTLWDELTATKAAAGGWPAVRSGSGDIKDEIAELSNVLDRVEERVQTLRKSLQELD